MYDPKVCEPMRKELTGLGVQELKTAAEVDSAVQNSKGSSMIVVNSVCGCAAGGARPGVALALKSPKIPQHLFSVFAGQDKEATDRARSYFHGYPASSPAVALLKDGKVVFMLPRQEIEGFSAEQIANKLSQAFEQYC